MRILAGGDIAALKLHLPGDERGVGRAADGDESGPLVQIAEEKFQARIIDFGQLR